MILFIIRKLIYGSIVLWGVLTVVFFLFNILPADPARMMLDKREDAEQLAVIKHKYGFDRPIIEQYFMYINDVSPFSIHSNDTEDFTSLETNKYDYVKLFSILEMTVVAKTPYLRESFVSAGESVVSIISRTFKNTFVLAFSAILIALLIGLLLGVLSAIYKDTFLDKLILFISALGMSLPSFFASRHVQCSRWIF